MEKNKARKGDAEGSSRPSKCSFHHGQVCSVEEAVLVISEFFSPLYLLI